MSLPDDFWERFRERASRLEWPTPEENAAIEAAAAEDPDNPIWPEEMIRAARPTAEVDPEFVATWVASRARRDAAE